MDRKVRFEAAGRSLADGVHVKRVKEGGPMFSSLDEQMKLDEATSSTSRERLLRYAGVAIASILVFGGLYAGILLFA